MTDNSSASSVTTTDAGSRRVYMNEQTSEDYDQVPFPARQQLGDQGGLVDARSGNGVDNVLGDPHSGNGGRPVKEVTYHLDSTPAPANRSDSPGSQAGARARAVSVGGSDGGYSENLVKDGWAFRQKGSVNLRSQMTTEPGRDERLMARRRDADENPGAKEASVIDVLDGGTGDHQKMPSGTQHDAQHPQGTIPDAPASQTSPGVTSGPSTSTASSSDDVPEGSVTVVLAWVGDDKSRAQRALDKEQAKDSPRSSLVSQLEDRLK